MKVIKVCKGEHWQKFFGLAREIYRRDRFWTPMPQDSEQVMFDPRANPLLRHVNVELFLALDKDRPVGRIAAITDELLADKKVGLFGCFEAVEDPEVARMLFEAVAENLTSRGKQQIQGPATINTSGQVGLQISGFEYPPQAMMPYNPAYYQGLVEQNGFEKLLDLYAYPWTPKATRDRKKFGAVAKRAARIPGIKIRPINLSDPVGEGKRLAEVHNESMTKQWGYVPMDYEEGAYFLAGMRSYADPELLTFCEVAGKVVGVCLIMPDLGPGIRAARRSFFPFMNHLVRSDSLRVAVLGVVPEYRLKGVVALLIERAIDTALRRGYRRGELSLIMDSNDQMNKIITSNVVDRASKTYRIYTKNIT